MTNVNDFISNNLTEPSRSISAKIFEQGCGFPSEGDILLHNDGRVFRVVEAGGTIHTGRAAGNYIHATLAAADDAEYADAPFEARVELD